MSIDDITSETQFTFVARSLVSWQPKEGDENWQGLADAATDKFENTAAARSINLANSLS